MIEVSELVEVINITVDEINESVNITVTELSTPISLQVSEMGAQGLQGLSAYQITPLYTQTSPTHISYSQDIHLPSVQQHK